MSYGGYWATKVAHLYADRLCGAVNWGGGIHTFFTRAWNERSKNASSYVMDLDIARARTVGADDYDELHRTGCRASRSSIKGCSTGRTRRC